MEYSKPVHDAFMNCLTFGDSEEVQEIIEKSGPTGIRMDYYTLEDGDDVSGAFMAGAEAEGVARSLGLNAFCSEFDGIGVWVFCGRSKGHIVSILQKVAAELAELCYEVEQEMEDNYPENRTGIARSATCAAGPAVVEVPLSSVLEPDDFCGLPKVNDEDC